MSKKKIPKEIKVQKIIEALSGKRKKKEILKELGITKQALNKWEKKVKEAILEAVEPKKKGRRPKNWVEEKDLREELSNTQSNLLKLEKEKKKLEKKMLLLEKDLYIAKNVARFWEKEEVSDLKKSAHLGRVIKQISSRVEDMSVS